ncbi:branched-chain amino acid ABC transporter permease [Salinibacterium sp. ZJ450]|uniref:branched-chain amino acid ABC transporter permease n=1 Tax=Salinibacterium sp. ZJ450 TaxID=2708338 RepID=UPI00351D7080
MFLVFIALLGALLMLTAAPAYADEVGADEPYKISGNVQNEGQPLEDVLITVTGNGVDLEVETDAEGRWRVGVPERDTYTVTLVESTLPEGIAVLEGGNVQEVEIGPGGRVTMNFFIGEGERNVTSFFDQLVSRIFNGLNFGLMLGLAAVGASLVYGTTGLANFAHAEMVTFGAVIALFFGTTIGMPMLAAIPLAILVSGAFGWAMDAGLWRPLRHKGLGLVQLMIVSIGLSLTLRYIFQYFIGGGTLQLPGSAEAEFPLFGAVTMSWIDIASMAMTVVVLVVFALWLLYTRMGKATRAISDNPSLAAASGIDVDRVVRWVWIISAAMAGLAGILYAYFRPGIKWDMGAQILLLVFASITLGGLGTAFGALIGSIIVGLLVEVSTLWIPSDLKYVGALGILIVILLFRPQGILGRKERIG